MPTKKVAKKPLRSAKDVVKERVNKIASPPRPQPPKPAARTAILEKANTLTTGDRNESYGSPLPNMECYTALMEGFLKGTSGKAMPAGVFASVIHCLNKISRIAANPAHMDNYVDLAAYAGIAGECASFAFGIEC
jgi:hypothetical protein